MNSLRSCFLITSVVLAACWISACHATSRVWEAKVTQSANTPCFAIGAPAEERVPPIEVGEISVFEVHPGGREVWAVSARKRGGVVLRSGECLQYGFEAPDVDVLVSPRGLELEYRYAVSINAGVNDDGRRGSRQYRAHFCVTSVDGERLAVHQVQWDRTTGEWGWDVCASP